jgi:hypothetical protein
MHHCVRVDVCPVSLDDGEGAGGDTMELAHPQVRMASEEAAYVGDELALVERAVTRLVPCAVEVRRRDL